MKAKLFLVPLAVAAVLFISHLRNSPPSQAGNGEYDEGFKGAPWGASQDQITDKLIGESIRPSNKRRIATRASYGDVTVFYYYHFRGNQLHEVAVNMPFYYDEDVRRKIQAEYGSPQDSWICDASSISPGVQKKCSRWINDKVAIKFEYVGEYTTGGYVVRAALLLTITSVTITEASGYQNREAPQEREHKQPDSEYKRQDIVF